MSSNWCKFMEAHNKRDLVEISQLIDLTDKPIGLARDEIGWSRVRSNGSNCICCCCNNSITLVTTDDSYILDHVPIDNILFAQTNSSLQYLAMSNNRKIAIIDLVDNDVKCGCGYSHNNNNSITTETKVVNLAAHSLTMSDIIFWRWLDDTTLAILSHQALYTCSVNQQHINHPAYTAFQNRSRYLSMDKIFDIHQNLSTFCQITDIQRDSTQNLYAISSLYSASNLPRPATSSNTLQHPNAAATTNRHSSSATLRPSFGSMPSKLSQLAGNEQGYDSLKSEQLMFGWRQAHHQQSMSSNTSLSSNEDEVGGLAQVYCRLRDRSQIIQAHALTFTNSNPASSYPGMSDDDDRDIQNKRPTILVAANKFCSNQMRVHFIEMATRIDRHINTGGENASPVTSFDRFSSKDFPTSIVCSHVSTKDNSYLHVALITTKHGQLFVCSVTHSTILFNTTITNDIISSTLLESNTQGLMVICRNGQVLLVKLNLTRLMKLLEESKTLRHISSAHNILSSMDSETDRLNGSHGSVGPISDPATAIASNQVSTSLDTGLEVIISTRL